MASIGKDNITAELLLIWAREFRAGDLSVDDVQNHFSALNVSSANDVSGPVKKRLAEAQQELDAIRWGMCESGQRAEIERIFVELERLICPGK